MQPLPATPSALPSQPWEPVRMLREACHELRAPVAAIAALAARVGGGEVAEADRVAATQLLADHAQHLAALLEGLSDAAGGPRPVPVCPDGGGAVWLPGLLLGAADAVGLAGHRLRLEVGPEVRHVAVDRAALRQVATNLLDNAGRHGAGAPVEVAARRAGARLILAIADRGPGLRAAERRRLLDGRGASIPAGWGVGWSVVRREVARLRGCVRLDARPGGGLVVTVEVPI